MKGNEHKEKPRSHARRPSSTAITVSMPAETLLSIDAEARATKRNRSNWIVYVLEKYLEEHAEEQPQKRQPQKRHMVHADLHPKILGQQ